MRQLTENLLRAAEGSPSLQDVGATIAGASAETDTSLPPGRYARFVDGYVAFFRGRHRPDNGWCGCLNDRYQNVMTPAEDSRYANDFERLFWDVIAEPNSTDPAWQRLHPAAVNECER
jgi:hypothetical protein